MTSRNVFENNEKPEVTQEEALELGDRVNALLPPLAEGYHYSLTKLTNGRTAVIVDQDETTEPSIDEHDRFGRHKL